MSQAKALRNVGQRHFAPKGRSFSQQKIPRSQNQQSPWTSFGEAVGEFRSKASCAVSEAVSSALSLIHISEPTRPRLI
eukprot:3193805-Rhodomonas_salina.1